ncbi:hypothetical protein OKW50_006175 [Paraburkholderia youngii]|uniref:Uncharacterized protein n=1 Tax=Paraburkholderia youngii TaxID=2782701 RepID=A0A7W8P3G6_9BURK|nr:hypothetical protein [Paraburkholderia youngii]MBB5402211.1 hypothetical protein [Paraburkholderia youngii]
MDMMTLQVKMFVAKKRGSAVASGTPRAGIRKSVLATLIERQG